MYHGDWGTYTTELDTSIYPSYVGLQIGIGIINRDWDWGRTYATNIRMDIIPEPATICLLAIGAFLTIRKRRI